MAKLSDELKEAILSLPTKEKNKLLLRLIAKNELLTDQLQYKLLENTPSDLKFRQQEVQEQIDFTSGRLTLKQILTYFRTFSGKINRFAKVTKDKQSELELWKYLCEAALIAFKQYRATLRDSQLKPKFKENALKKITKMYTLLEGLHEDYHLEYMDDLKQLEKDYKQL
jgi:hypothetical protein